MYTKNMTKDEYNFFMKECQYPFRKVLRIKDTHEDGLGNIVDHDGELLMSPYVNDYRYCGAEWRDMWSNIHEYKGEIEIAQVYSSHDTTDERFSETLSIEDDFMRIAQYRPVTESEIQNNFKLFYGDIDPRKVVNDSIKRYYGEVLEKYQDIWDKMDKIQNVISTKGTKAFSPDEIYQFDDNSKTGFKEKVMGLTKEDIEWAEGFQYQEPQKMKKLRMKQKIMEEKDKYLKRNHKLDGLWYNVDDSLILHKRYFVIRNEDYEGELYVLTEHPVQRQPFPPYNEFLNEPTFDSIMDAKYIVLYERQRSYSYKFPKSIIDYFALEVRTTEALFYFFEI